MGCDKCKKQPIPYEETNYGFKYGAATIERNFSDDKKGWVVIGITTPKTTLQVYVTKTGKVRVYNYYGGELFENPEFRGRLEDGKKLKTAENSQ